MIRSIKNYLTILCLVLMNSIAFAADKPITSDEAVATLEQWRLAFNACDVDGLTAMYASNALFWATTATAPITTSDGVRAYFKATCSGPVKLQMTTDAITSGSFGDVASLITAPVLTFTVQGQQQTLRIRFSMSVMRIDGIVKIVEHHSSMMPAPAPSANSATK